MLKFAVIENNNVLNIIVADSKEIAEQVTGHTCIEYADSNMAEPGGTFDGVDFIPRQPYPSWVLNEFKSWVAPVPKPDLGEDWVWDEETVQWKEITPSLE